MRCANCGKETLDEAPYCAWCGYKHGYEDELRFLGAGLGTMGDAASKGLWLGLASFLMAAIAVLLLAWRSWSDLPGGILLLMSPVVAGAGLTAAWAAWKQKREKRHGAREWLGLLLNGLMLSGFLALVLAAVLLPFMHHHEPVKQSKSLNNIRQLGLAVQQYSNDYNETFPGWVVRPDGRPVHNCWDEQIDPFVKAKDVYYDDHNSGPGIRSSSDPHRQRVLSYGMNGLLIAESDGNGNADWSKGPNPLSPSSLNNPASTILLAELDTEQSPAAIDSRYGEVEAIPRIHPVASIPRILDKTQRSGIARAHTGWIDIDPRAWVEQGKGAAAYNEEIWGDAAKRGVARDLHGGGGVYAFCDGHVAFLKLIRTTTSGQNNMAPNANWTVNVQTNPYNMWLPN